MSIDLPKNGDLFSPDDLTRASQALAQHAPTPPPQPNSPEGKPKKRSLFLSLESLMVALLPPTGSNEDSVSTAEALQTGLFYLDCTKEEFFNRAGTVHERLNFFIPPFNPTEESSSRRARRARGVAAYQKILFAIVLAESSGRVVWPAGEHRTYAELNTLLTKHTIHPLPDIPDFHGEEAAKKLKGVDGISEINF